MLFFLASLLPALLVECAPNLGRPKELGYKIEDRGDKALGMDRGGSYKKGRQEKTLFPVCKEEAFSDIPVL